MTGTELDTEPGDGSLYHLTYDWEDSTELGTELLLALQRLTGQDAADMEPLSSRVDPEALDSLFRSIGTDGAGGELAFRYEGHAITVRDTGEVLITPDSTRGTAGGSDG